MPISSFDADVCISYLVRISCGSLGGDDTKTYKQLDAKELQRFWTKIWQPKKHNEKAEWINNMTREVEGLDEGPKAKIHIDLRKKKKKNTRKNIKLENARP